jgi:hypothetical protein
MKLFEGWVAGQCSTSMRHSNSPFSVSNPETLAPGSVDVTVSAWRFGSGQGCCARGARRLRQHHIMHSAGRLPAAGFDRLQRCRARGDRQLRPSSALCGPPSGSRLLPVAGPRHAGASPASTPPSAALCGPLSGSWLCSLCEELAGFDDTIICTLQAAVRQPAPAGCRAAARGGPAGFDDIILCPLLATVRQTAPAGCWAAASGGLAGFVDTMCYTLRAAVRVHISPDIAWPMDHSHSRAHGPMDFRTNLNWTLDRKLPAQVDSSWNNFCLYRALHAGFARFRLLCRLLCVIVTIGMTGGFSRILYMWIT